MSVDSAADHVVANVTIMLQVKTFVSCPEHTYSRLL